MAVPVVVSDAGLDAVVIPFPDKMIEALTFTLTSTEEVDLFELTFVIPITKFCTDQDLLEQKEAIYRGMLTHFSDSLFDKFYQASPREYEMSSYTKIRLGKYFQLPEDQIQEIASKVIAVTRREEPYEVFDESTLSVMELGVVTTVDIRVDRAGRRRLFHPPMRVESKISMSPKTKKGKKKMFFGLFR